MQLMSAQTGVLRRPRADENCVYRVCCVVSGGCVRRFVVRFDGSLRAMARVWRGRGCYCWCVSAPRYLFVRRGVCRGLLFVRGKVLYYVHER